MTAKELRVQWDGTTLVIGNDCGCVVRFPDRNSSEMRACHHHAPHALRYSRDEIVEEARTLAAKIFEEPDIKDIREAKRLLESDLVLRDHKCPGCNRPTGLHPAPRATRVWCADCAREAFESAGMPEILERSVRPHPAAPGNC